MSLPDNALFDRVAAINIGGRYFSYPPFSIAFDQTMKIGKLTTTKAKLYNPNPDTIKTAEGTKAGRTRIYPAVVIDAGYIDDNGTAVLGEVHDFKVKKTGPDIILEMSIGDKTSKWANSLVGKTWKNTQAYTILSDIISSAGITTEISLGKPKLYRTLTIRTLREGIKKIAKDTDSQYYFRNGILRIEPKTPVRTKQVQFISPESGLIDKIEKNAKGFKFKTLFFYHLQMGDIVQIEDKNIPSTNVKLVEGKKKFSTFGNAGCEFRAVAI